MKAHGIVDAKVHIFAAMTLERERVASPTLGRLYPWKAPVQKAEWTLGPAWTRRSEKKKNLHPSDTRDRTRAVQLVAKRLGA